MAILPKTSKRVIDNLLCSVVSIGLVILSVLVASKTKIEYFHEDPVDTQPISAVHIYTHDELSNFYSCTKQPTCETTLQFTQEEAMMLMRLAKHEAGYTNTDDISSDNINAKSQALIMLVVINRVKSDKFPNTITEVLYQKNPVQFSIFIDGSIMNTEPDFNSHLALALIESGWDESQGAIYYDAEWGGNTWQSKNCELLYIDQGTRFYK